jgi:putative ABC transport system permease protein
VLDTLRQDAHFALRTLSRNRGFALVMVLTLALGTGANTAIFSVVESVLLKPLPYPQDDRLVELWSTGGLPGTMKARMSLSYQEVQDAGGLHEDFTGLAAYTQTRYNLTGRGEPREVQATLTSSSLFDVLGVHPALGRSLTAADLREPVVVLSHGLWLQLFGGDAGAVGRVVTLDGNGYTVVGVMPAGFAFPDEGTQLWAPLGLGFVARPEMETDPNFHALNAVARLRDGIDVTRLESDLSVLAARRNSSLSGRKGAGGPQGAGPQAGAPQAGAPQAGGQQQMRIEVQGGAPPGGAGAGGPQIRMGRPQPPGFAVALLRNEAVGDARTPLLVLMAVVGFVLIIACVNAANLLLARSSARQRELAVRRALGAGRGRLVAQVLTESVLLAFAGGLVGLVFAEIGLSAILAFWPAVLPRTHAIGLDVPTLVYVVLISVVTGIAFGLAPALQASSVALESSLREGGSSVTAGRGRHRLQRGLVVAEIALALVVLTGAGLLVRSFVLLRSIDPGYDVHDVLAARIRLTPARYETQAQQLDFYQQVVEQLERQPGVEAASVARTLPMSGQIQILAMDPRTVRPDDPEPFLAMGLGVVGPGFFRSLHIPLLAGRAFTDEDRGDTQPVAIINAALAKRLWPGQNPVGQTVSMPLPGQRGRGRADITIVGEIGNVHYASLTDPVKPEIYFPFTQAGSMSETGAWIVARASRDPLGLGAAVRRSVEAIDPQQPVAALTTLSGMLSRSTAARRLNMTLVGLFALLALGLAVVGIYGVTAYTVEQRTQEIGVRVALGAARGNVLRLLLVETAAMAGLGIAIGLAGALGATRVLASLLYEVSATDAVTFVLTTVVLGGAALLAALVPALRAARIDPVQALRSE